MRCCPIHCATGLATPLPHILYRVVSAFCFPSARWRVWLSAHPISRSHSIGVSLRTCIVSSLVGSAATNGTLLPPVPIFADKVFTVFPFCIRRPSRYELSNTISTVDRLSPVLSNAFNVGHTPPSIHVSKSWSFCARRRLLYHKFVLHHVLVPDTFIVSGLE